MLSNEEVLEYGMPDMYSLGCEASERGCKKEWSQSLDALIMGGEAEFIAEAVEMIQELPVVPYKDNYGQMYLGVANSCKKCDCQSLIQVGIDFYCQNHAKIRQYLLAESNSEK